MPRRHAAQGPAADAACELLVARLAADAQPRAAWRDAAAALLLEGAEDGAADAEQAGSSPSSGAAAVDLSRAEHAAVLLDHWAAWLAAHSRAGGAVAEREGGDWAAPALDRAAEAAARALAEGGGAARARGLVALLGCALGANAAGMALLSPAAARAAAELLVAAAEAAAERGGGGGAAAAVEALGAALAGGRDEGGLWVAAPDLCARGVRALARLSWRRALAAAPVARLGRWASGEAGGEEEDKEEEDEEEAAEEAACQGEGEGGSADGGGADWALLPEEDSEEEEEALWTGRADGGEAATGAGEPGAAQDAAVEAAARAWAGGRLLAVATARLPEAALAAAARDLAADLAACAPDCAARLPPPGAVAGWAGHAAELADAAAAAGGPHLRAACLGSLCAALPPWRRWAAAVPSQLGGLAAAGGRGELGGTALLAGLLGALGLRPLLELEAEGEAKGAAQGGEGALGPAVGALAALLCGGAALRLAGGALEGLDGEVVDGGEGTGDAAAAVRATAAEVRRAAAAAAADLVTGTEEESSAEEPEGPDEARAGPCAGLLAATGHALLAAAAAHGVDEDEGDGQAAGEAVPLAAAAALLRRVERSALAGVAEERGAPPAALRLVAELCAAWLAPCAPPGAAGPSSSAAAGAPAGRLSLRALLRLLPHAARPVRAAAAAQGHEGGAALLAASGLPALSCGWMQHSLQLPPLQQPLPPPATGPACRRAALQGSARAVRCAEVVLACLPTAAARGLGGEGGALGPGEAALLPALLRHQVGGAAAARQGGAGQCDGLPASASFVSVARILTVRREPVARSINGLCA